MATPNGRGGWDLTDADVDAIAAASGFEVERDVEVKANDPATYSNEALKPRTSGPMDGSEFSRGPNAMSQEDAAEHDERVRAALAAQRAQDVRPVPPWSAEYKLRHALGRPALAKRITDALPQPLAVELGDILWLILEQRVAEEVRAVQAAVDHVVREKLEWYEIQAQQKREELTHERFGRTTRLD